MEEGQEERAIPLCLQKEPLDDILSSQEWWLSARRLAPFKMALRGLASLPQESDSHVCISSISPYNFIRR